MTILRWETWKHNTDFQTIYSLRLPPCHCNEKLVWCPQINPKINKPEIILLSMRVVNFRYYHNSRFYSCGVDRGDYGLA